MRSTNRATRRSRGSWERSPSRRRRCRLLTLALRQSARAKVYVAEDRQLEAPLPQPRVDVLARLVGDKGIETVLFANSVLAADVAAGLAARLDAGLNWDLVDLTKEGDRLVGKRPALQDSVYVDVGWTSEPRIALFRSGSFDPSATGGSAEIAELDVTLEDFSTAARMV